MGSLPLVVKSAQSVEDVLHLLNGCHKVCNSKVVSSRLLLEATSWHGHYTGLVDHVHAVEEIRFDTLRVCFVYKLLREVHARETVHSALNLSARNVFHVVESRGEKVSLIFHG